MGLMLRDLKLAVEPAPSSRCRSAYRADCARHLKGKRVGLVGCGANINSGNFTKLIERGGVKGCREMRDVAQAARSFIAAKA